MAVPLAVIRQDNDLNDLVDLTDKCLKTVMYLS